MAACDKHESYAEHIKDRLGKFAINQNLLLNMLELIQYTLLYTITFVYIGSIIDSYFVNPDIKTDTTGTLLMKLCLQMVVDILAIYFIRKLVKTIPFIGEGIKGYIPHCGVFEFEGEIAIGLIFIATQRNLIKGVAELYDRINTK